MPEKQFCQLCLKIITSFSPSSITITFLDNHYLQIYIFDLQKCSIVEMQLFLECICSWNILSSPLASGWTNSWAISGQTSARLSKPNSLPNTPGKNLDFAHPKDNCRVGQQIGWHIIWAVFLTERRTLSSPLSEWPHPASLRKFSPFSYFAKSMNLKTITVCLGRITVQLGRVSVVKWTFGADPGRVHHLSLWPVEHMELSDSIPLEDRCEPQPRLPGLFCWGA